MIKPIKLFRSSSFPASERSYKELVENHPGDEINIIPKEDNLSLELQTNELVDRSKNEVDNSIPLFNISPKEEINDNTEDQTAKVKNLYKKVVFLVSECSSWSNCGSKMSSLVVDLVNWLNSMGILVLVPKNYLDNVELTQDRKFKKLSAWAGHPE